MPTNADAIALLVSKYVMEELNEDEKLQLNKWLDESENHRLLFDKLLDGERVKHRIEVRRKFLERRPKAKVIGMSRSWFRSVAAAAVLIIVAGTIFFMVSKTKEKPGNEIAQTNQDIAPGKQSATLKLADGSTIVLDSSASGKLAQQGITQVLNKNGELVYEAPSKYPPKEETLVAYNILSTSRGQTYPLILSDNSRVWLNSESSIRFPVSFTSKERKVEITGEVYFEITPDASKPFIVTGSLPSGGPGWAVQVLGTKFNVNAYSDEGVIKTTLLEGSVRVSKGIQQKQIRRGQQAQVIANEIMITDNVDIEKIIAWKNGFFTFKNDKLGDVMGDIARWYNIEIVYEGNAGNVEVAGDIHRTSNLSEVLKILSLLKVESRIEGRKLILKAQ